MHMRVIQTIVSTISQTDEVEAVEMQLYKGDDPLAALANVVSTLRDVYDCMYRTLDIRITF